MCFSQMSLLFHVIMLDIIISKYLYFNHMCVKGKNKGKDLDYMLKDMESNSKV